MSKRWNFYLISVPLTRSRNTMSLLTIHPENRPDDAEVIRARGHRPEALGNRCPVRTLDRRQSCLPTPTRNPSSKPTAESIDRLIDRYEFRSVDVVRIQPDNPKSGAARHVSKRTYTTISRSAFSSRKDFYLHPNDKVYVLLCEQE